MAREQSTKVKRYRHAAYRFSIVPPDGWIVMEPGVPPAIVTFVGPPKGGPPAHISIEVQDAKGLTLKEYDRASKARAKKTLKNYVLLGDKDRKIGNVNGHEVRIGFRTSVVLAGAQICYAINGRRLYVVTCMSVVDQFARYAPTFDKALNTFRVW